MKLTKAEQDYMDVTLRIVAHMKTKHAYRTKERIMKVMPSTKLPETRAADKRYTAYIIHNGGKVTVRLDVLREKGQIVIEEEKFKVLEMKAKMDVYKRIEARLRRNQYAVTGVTQLLEHGYEAKELLDSDDRVKRMRARQMAE